MRDTYDIVIIGGGHNGLVAGLEFARAGLSACILEARPRVGGCATTTEPLLPGFRHDPHANCFLFADLFPPGISPSNLGVTVLQPAAQFGVAFEDGRPPVILHRPDLLAQTRASLSVWSASDALTYVRMKRRSEALGTVLRRGLYAPPHASWSGEQRRAVAKAFAPFCKAQALGRRSVRQLVEGLFATDEIRLLLYALALETGVGLEDPGGDLAFLGYSLWIAGRWRAPVGGMQSYADALRTAAEAGGASVLVSTPVDRVLIEDGRAHGVRTADGREILAARAVVSAIPILHLFDHLVPSDVVASAERAELETFRVTASPSIGSSAFCLDAMPHYKSARHDPGIDRCLKTVVGYQTSSDILEQAAAVSAGLLPRPAGTVRVHSLWDGTLAPSGRHIASVDSHFPSMATMEQATWRHVAAAFPAALFDVWRRSLAGDHPQPVMGMTLDDTLGFERRMLIREGAAQYRTSIPGLYLAGPGVYPGGGVHGACGLNAAKTVLEDQAGAAC